jgi:hypothetical protein
MKSKKTRKVIILSDAEIAYDMISNPEKWVLAKDSASMLPLLDSTDRTDADQTDQNRFTAKSLVGTSLAARPILYAMWLQLRALYIIYKDRSSAYDINFYNWLVTRRGNRLIREGIARIIFCKGDGIFYHSDLALVLETALMDT